jgi:hypothetical protein
MHSKTTLVTLAFLIVGIGLAAVLLIRSQPQPGRARITPQREEDRQASFIARFDSLTDARLHPVVWRSGTFTKTGFDENRETWTLTVSSGDWELRDEASKKDLAATLHSTFQSVRAQAGGDPDKAVLVIRNREGEVLLRASAESGVVVRR